MKFTETMHCYSRDEWHIEHWLIEQPVFYRVRALALLAFDRATYRLPIFKTVWSRATKFLEGVALRRHERTCRDDCGTFYHTTPGDPPGRIEMTPDRAEPGCTRMPLEIRWDCWVYDIVHKKHTILTRH